MGITGCAGVGDSRAFIKTASHLGVQLQGLGNRVDLSLPRACKWMYLRFSVQNVVSSLNPESDGALQGSCWLMCRTRMWWQPLPWSPGCVNICYDEVRKARLPAQSQGCGSFTAAVT